jgi:hypothetical protein
MPNSSAAGSNVDRQEIDRILRAKRQQRETKACYPCRSRKVKCDNGHPCRTCQKRGHPQICVYDLEESSPRKRAMLSPQNSISDASYAAFPSGLGVQMIGLNSEIRRLLCILGLSQNRPIKRTLQITSFLEKTQSFPYWVHTTLMDQLPTRRALCWDCKIASAITHSLISKHP